MFTCRRRTSGLLRENLGSIGRTLNCNYLSHFHLLSVVLYCVGVDFSKAIIDHLLMRLKARSSGHVLSRDEHRHRKYSVRPTSADRVETVRMMEDLPYDFGGVRQCGEKRATFTLLLRMHVFSSRTREKCVHFFLLRCSCSVSKAIFAYV